MNFGFYRDHQFFCSKDTSKDNFEKTIPEKELGLTKTVPEKDWFDKNNS